MRRCGVVKNAPTSGIAGIHFKFSGNSNCKSSRQVSRWATGLACIAATFFWTGCIQSGSSGSNSGPLAITASDGSLQSAAVSTAFGKPLVAVATKGGQPSKGVSVTFTAPASGASGTFANGAATETDTTDSNGLATSSKFTANSTDGAYNVTATASGAQASATFSLTNLAAAQLTISAQNGSAQSVLTGMAFSTPFSVVVDQNGSPIQGVSVTFTAPSSGASGTFNGGSLTDTVTTDANGQATSSAFTANSTPGQYNVLAAVVGGSAPAQFSLSNLSSGSLTVVAAGGSPQSAAIATAFGQPLQVGVFNAGLGVQGVTVTFTAPPQSGASGTFTGGVNTENDVTDSTGTATAHTFTANQTTGTYQVTGTISGNTEVADFNLTNSTALTVSMGGGDGQTTQVGTQFAAPLVAHVTDTQNNSVIGVTVTFAAPGSGASGSYTSGGTSPTAQVPTDQSGNASTPFFANSTAGGPYAVTASVSGGTSSATFNLTNSTSAVAGVIPTGGIIQRAAISTPFGKKFVVTVLDHNGAPLSGQSVTFTAPPATAGASGTFPGGASEVDTTDANGKATSNSFTANGTAGSYTVTASDGSVSGNFSLMNTAAAVTSYTFYASGQSMPHSVGASTNYYAIAGAIIVDQTNGAVLGGEEDYNDANGYTYASIPITGGTLSVDVNGQGTLSLSVPSQPTLGNMGTQTLAVQFVNTNHALIAQWDGSATSSGTMDVQDLTNAPSGGYAFTFSGVDPSYAPIGFGGVFSITGNLLNPQYSMSLDVNDANYGLVQQPNMSGFSITSLDDYGRGQIKGVALNTQPAINLTLYFYLIGAEALRVIDMDTTIAAVGSAFGQGVNGTSGSNSALGQSVFAIAGSPSTGNPNSAGTTSYAALGQFTTDGAGTLPSGIGDEKELATNFLIGVDLGNSGTYQVGSNGYGTLTLPSGKLGNVSSLGLYLTDPAVNLNDPNNTTGGGGGLLLDLDTALPGGTGFVISQTDPSAASFTGSYAAGWQNLNSFHGVGLEFDMLAQGKITATTNPPNLTLGGLVSDPFGTVNNGTPLESSLASFTSSPDTDTSHPGRYTMLGSNPNNNLLDMTIQGTTVAREFNEVVYQANGAQLFWIDVDNNGFTFDAVSYGPLELQGSLSGIPLARKGSGKLRKGGTAPDAQRRVPES